MSAFCKLADPSSYVACPWGLSRDAAGASHWAVFFKRHLETILALGAAAARERGESGESVDRRGDACRHEFHQIFDRFAASPDAQGRVTILTLVHWRDGTLRKHGFVDAFVELKARENEKMLPMLAPLCRELDAIPDQREQLRAIVEGVFAGNIFDMGAEATAKAFLAESPPAFLEVRAKLPRRPWRIDDYDRLESRLLEGPRHRKVVYFIDNAGSDFLLGALPMMRWLARRGTRVVLAANEGPTLNDMTIHDVHDWW